MAAARPFLVFALAFATALGLQRVATAQDFFDDNELRAQLLAVADEVIEAEERTTLIAGQVDRLQTETQQLKNLIGELQTALGTSQAKSEKREEKIAEVVARAEATLQEHAAKAEQDSRFLRSILEGLDGREYSAALDAYGNLGDVEGSLRALRKIAGYGKLSPYAGSARYWIGRINYQQGDFEAARPELEGFIEDHSGDHRVPDAMLLLAEMAHLQDSGQAARIEDEILRLHPTSAAADRLRALAP